MYVVYVSSHTVSLALHTAVCKWCVAQCSASYASIALCTVHSALLHVHLNDRRVHLAAGRRAHPLKCALSTSFAFYSTTATTIICCSPLCTLLFLSDSHSSLLMLLKLCRSNCNQYTFQCFCQKMALMAGPRSPVSNKYGCQVKQ